MTLTPMFLAPPAPPMAPPIMPPFAPIKPPGPLTPGPGGGLPGWAADILLPDLPGRQKPGPIKPRPPQGRPSGAAGKVTSIERPFMFRVKVAQSFQYGGTGLRYCDGSGQATPAFVSQESVDISPWIECSGVQCVSGNAIWAGVCGLQGRVVMGRVPAGWKIRNRMGEWTDWNQYLEWGRTGEQSGKVENESWTKISTYIAAVEMSPPFVWPEIGAPEREPERRPDEAPQYPPADPPPLRPPAPPIIKPGDPSKDPPKVPPIWEPGHPPPPKPDEPPPNLYPPVYPPGHDPGNKPGQKPGNKPDQNPGSGVKPGEKPGSGAGRPDWEEDFLDGVIGSPAQRPTATLEGLARITGKIEEKLVIVGNKIPSAGQGGGLPEGVGEALMKLIDWLNSGYEPGGYPLVSPCGAPATERWATWAGGNGALNELSAKVDALAELIQIHKDMGQKICRGKIEGERVTVRFREEY